MPDRPDHDPASGGPASDEPSAEPPIDALTTEPPEFGEPRSSVLTPMGEVESIGDFSRGLGARRAKIAIFGVGGLLMLLALLAALQ
jgi:hypothetical protein